MFNTISGGLAKRVSAPVFGQQDVGIAPGGAMDRFAYRSGNILLGNPAMAEALEIVFAPELAAETDGYFVLTGAAHQDVRLSASGAGATAIEHGRVYFAPRGATLTFGEKAYGLRTYLCFRSGTAAGDIAGRTRGDFRRICTWPDPGGRVRIVEGPEFAYLQNPGDFLDKVWETTRDMSDMGMRLAHPQAQLKIEMPSMISAPVSDGTVQLTPKGPIILLRHRQTVGGYPRIFNVISADVDLLAQFAPQQRIRFKKVTLEAARAAARQKEQDLAVLQTRFGVHP